MRHVFLRRSAVFIVAIVSALVGGILFWYARRRLTRPLPVSVTTSASLVSGISGLSEAEVAARQLPLDREALRKADWRRFRRAVVRKHLFTFFNLDIVGVGIAMYLLGSPWSAVLSLAVLVISFGLSVFQETYTKRKLDQLVARLQPQATVIRAGEVRSLPLEEVVSGDMLLAAAGDRILVDGEVVGEGDLWIDDLSGPAGVARQRSRVGDAVYASNICVQGEAVYRAGSVQTAETLMNQGLSASVLSHKLTPLQRLIKRILQCLFVLVLAFVGVFVLEFSADLLGVYLFQDVIRDTVSLIFGIAPTSLFLMIAVNYAVGLLRIADVGALVYHSETVESLANTSVVCFSSSETLTGQHAVLEPIPAPAGHNQLAESRLRQILGDYLHSAAPERHIPPFLAQAFSGQPRETIERVSFYSALDWSGVRFDLADLRGTYLLGEAERLKPYLVTGTVEDGIEAIWNGGRMSKDTTQAGLAGFKRQWLARLRRWFTPESIEIEADSVVNPGDEVAGLSLLFAYHPHPVALHDAAGKPQIPNNLIPLGWLHFSERVRPEAAEVVQAFVKAGVSIKILSAQAPGRLAATVKELRLSDDESPVIISGADLAGMEAASFVHTVQKQDFFAHLTSTQQAAIVRQLRLEDEYVAMVGNQVNDIPAIRQANLGITSQAGSQATLTLADIVLLDESLAVLPNVFYRGQQIVNGLLDTFKLYLTHAASHLFLVVSILPFLAIPFPYSPTQATIISSFAITIPAIFLPFWSSIGRVPERSIFRQLAFFVLPAALTNGLLALGVFYWFSRITADQVEANLAVTYALIGAGLLRIIFVNPPTTAWVAGNSLSGDPRPVWMTVWVAVVFLLFVAITAAVPLFQEWFHVYWLAQPQYYLIVALAVGVWAIVTWSLWRLLGLWFPLANRD